jgi:hypothetical protein
MKTWRKLLFFGIGVTLGILMVKFIFGGRDDIQCSYFPNDRVLYDLRNKDRMIPDSTFTQMQELGVDTSDISDLLLMGDVDFEKSDTKKDSCKNYWISFEPEDKPSFYAIFGNCDSTAVLKQVAR